METNVLIVDIRGILTNSNEDVMERHSNYAIAMKSIEPKSKLYILSRGNGRISSPTENLEIISSNSIRSFFKSGASLLKTLKGSILLVGGDPWEGFWACWLLKKLSGSNAPIQVQIHADTGSLAWRKLNWRNRVRSIFLKYSLDRADQIRCVSKRQLENILEISSKIRDRCAVIPVPVSIMPDWDEKRKFDSRISLAIVGRVHRDRGLEEFVRICHVLSGYSKEISFFIVGDGPHTDWLRDKLRELNLLEHSSFVGQKSQAELSTMWKSFGAIVSIAPSEAFGRSAREALVYGVPVLAKRSSGLDDLESSFGKNGIWFIDGLSDSELQNLFIQVSKFIVPKRIGESIIEDMNSLAMKLAKLWIDTSRKFTQKKK
jgi:glycosyltransferase involved in cell wall biosynthesis